MDNPLIDAEVIEFSNIQEYLVDNPASTFLLRIGGESMVGKGMYDGDIVVVDKSLSPKDRDVVVAYYRGGFTIKEFHRSPLKLVAYDTRNTEYLIGEGDDFEIFGVVVGLVRPLKTANHRQPDEKNK